MILQFYQDFIRFCFESREPERTLSPRKRHSVSRASGQHCATSFRIKWPLKWKHIFRLFGPTFAILHGTYVIQTFLDYSGFFQTQPCKKCITVIESAYYSRALISCLDFITDNVVTTLLIIHVSFWKRVDA